MAQSLIAPSAAAGCDPWSADLRRSPCSARGSSRWPRFRAELAAARDL